MSSAEPEPPTEPIELEKKESALFLDPERTMVFVAHEDDDVGLLTPDSFHTIRAGRTFQSVVLTAGDAGFVDCADQNGYIKGREEGELAAYARMAKVPFDPNNPAAVWTAVTPNPKLPNTGMTYRKYFLTSHPNISVIYLSLPNNDKVKGLADLWNAHDDSLKIQTWRQEKRRPVDQFTRQTLIATLLELMVQFQPTHISTLDSSELYPPSYPFDHPDHINSALFALAASQHYTTPHTFRTYRTYNPMFTEPANVSANDTAVKLQLLTDYSVHDAWFPNQSNNFCPLGVVSICGSSLEPCQDPSIFWPGFQARQWTATPTQGNRSVGAIAGPFNKCLQASGTTPGSSVSLATCSVALASQSWKVNADYTIRQKSSGLCVTAAGAASAFRPRGTGLTLQACPVTPSFEQQFFLTTDGQLRGPDATCVAAAGNALSIQECSNDDSKLSFRLQSPSATIPVLASGFTDAQIPDAASAYRTLHMADIDNDRDSDVCFRGALGIYCSTFNGSAFSAPSLKLTQFTDAGGYHASQYGSTVQLADINKDGRADVCGRSANGISCATWSGTTLGNFRQRSTAFTGYSEASNYGSIRFPDVNGDGYADVCGRSSKGIECALNCAQVGTGSCAANDGTGYFLAPTLWLSSEFTDPSWNSEEYGSTIQFGDVDGDGKQDVCGRADDGIHCALHDPVQNLFGEPHLFGASDDYDDLTGWGLRASAYDSIRLADINGDGRADVCGRRDSGLACGISMGSSFGFSQLMIASHSFDDNSGWDADRYGATLMFGDLNGDKHADVCGRGPLPSGGIGLRCVFSP
ncbi:MAG: Rhs family protein [Myxococcaceae bacterium]|nr:Rhs family protein [Myxococcaceae bacterium]